MLPHLFTIGGFSLPTYGALVATAFLVGLWMTSRFAKQRGVSSEKVVNLGVYCALVGMLGAKLLMIAMDPMYRQHPAEIFTRETLQSAGIFYGGFIAALVFAFLYMRAQHMPILGTADLFAPGVAIGHGIGRLGCFSAGCCWGKPTSLPWAVTFTSKDTTTGVPLGVPLHPTQLYEAFAEGIICLILVRMLSRSHRTGQVIGMYFLLYGMVRFAVEFLREHDESNPFGGPFVLEQWISLAVAVAGAWLLTRRTAQPVPAAATA
ncbi:MAG TPA: prolipoprotein diacylglyceryl transferase [Bryobacteraceae bacterium]|nr:prolipoprotein diacylglyceryl transferase [Bryobacteraceae bacterium]